MKVKSLVLFAMAAAGPTVAYFVARARDKGIPDDISRLLSEITALIKDGSGSRYLIVEKEENPFFLHVETSEGYSPISLRKKEGRGIFRQACLDEIDRKLVLVIDGQEKFTSIRAILNFFQPEATFLWLLWRIRRIEGGKANDVAS